MTRETKPIHSSGQDTSLSIDWERYGAMLDASDLSDAQKREFLETLWSIVTMFVDLGFGVHAVQQVCGQDDLDTGDLAAHLVNSSPTSTTSDFGTAATPVVGALTDSDTDRGEP